MHIRTALLFATLGLLTAASLALSLLSGSVETGPGTLLAALTGSSDDVIRQILLELRWPRTAAAFVTGALLALAGALMQVLLRNPLADPYVLGISGGAATGALLSMLLGLGGWWLQGSAFGGALASMLLVFGLARGSGAWSTHRLLLTGVVIAAGWGAVIGFLVLIVGFCFHWIGQLMSVLNWDLAIKLGLQEKEQPKEYKVYEHAIAVADVSIGWIYGVAGIGLVMDQPWAYKLLWIPGSVLVYHAVSYWFWTGNRSRDGHSLESKTMRICWTAINLITGLLALLLAWQAPA